MIMAIQGWSYGNDMNARYDQVEALDIVRAIDQIEFYLANVDQSVDKSKVFPPNTLK